MMSGNNWVGGILVAAGLLGVAGVSHAADNKVVLYTAHKSSIVQKMIPLFEAETGIKAEVVQLGSGDVFRRARAEAAAPKADVIWSVTGSLLGENADLLTPYAPKDQAAIDPRFVSSPAWTPYTTVIYVLMVNTRMVKDAEVPKTWAALSDPKWKGKVASARVDNSGSAFQQMTTVLTAGGDKGWENYGKLAKNFVFSDSSGAVPRFVADGEAPLGLTLEDNALEYVAGGAPVKISYIEDGTTTSPDGVAMLKGAPNPELREALHRLGPVEEDAGSAGQGSRAPLGAQGRRRAGRREAAFRADPGQAQVGRGTRRHQGADREVAAGDRQLTG